MKVKARLWTGGTLLIVIILNYALIGVPLLMKSASVNEKYRTTLIKQAKSTNVFRASDDEYMLEILRKEKASVDRKILILNCAAGSLMIILGSWVGFGLLFHRK